jgi:hypothetical protein
MIVILPWRSRCGELRTFGKTTFVCIRPPHEGPQPYVDNWRRHHGKTVGTDRHVFVVKT